MNIIRQENITTLKYHTRQLMYSMLSPLCGLNQEIGYVCKTSSDMKLMIGSAALTGVHVLLNYSNPGRGAYHIGGTGYFANESMIRILAESIERYSQLMSNFSFSSSLKFASYQELQKNEENILDLSQFFIFDQSQYDNLHFPFEKFSPDKPCSWIKILEINQFKSTWVPAQFVLVGYQIKKKDYEPWLLSAVTTGTATHINYELACKAALLELIQIDSAMGHWYSNWPAYEVIFDERLQSLTNLIKKCTGLVKHHYHFYYIPNADLAGFTIACVYFQERGLPKTVIGLGVDLSLENAMYKALLETAASVGLARMVIFKGKYKIDQHVSEIDPKAIYDLDRNVEYYAKGKNFSRIEERFLNMKSIKASELPQDFLGSIKEQLRYIINSFGNNKQLYYLDLTNEEENNLGFKVVRFWSPQTLSLCLPSAPPLLHKRFTDYGQCQHQDPHPYP